MLDIDFKVVSKRRLFISEDIHLDLLELIQGDRVFLTFVLGSPELLGPPVVLEYFDGVFDGVVEHFRRPAEGDCLDEVLRLEVKQQVVSVHEDHHSGVSPRLAHLADQVVVLH